MRAARLSAAAVLLMVQIASAEAERKRSSVQLPSNARALDRWLIAGNDSRELAWALVDQLHDRQWRKAVAMPEHLARPDGWTRYHGIYGNPRQKWQRERDKALRRPAALPLRRAPEVERLEGHDPPRSAHLGR